jgi:starvation-inducible DNA-binding protein
MAEKESRASELLEELRGALAETWAFYFKAHSFHWNVRGPMFNQWHDFFGALYQDAHGAVDDIAEHIRALNELAPSSLDEIVMPSKIKFTPAPDADGMVKQLRTDNEIVIAALEVAQDCAEDADDEGLANFLQDRLDKHAKWGWKLTASDGTKTQPRPSRQKFDKVAKDYVG